MSPRHRKGEGPGCVKGGLMASGNEADDTLAGSRGGDEGTLRLDLSSSVHSFLSCTASCTASSTGCILPSEQHPFPMVDSTLLCKAPVKFIQSARNMRGASHK